MIKKKNYCEEHAYKRRQTQGLLVSYTERIKRNSCCHSAHKRRMAKGGVKKNSIVYISFDHFIQRVYVSVFIHDYNNAHYSLK